MNDSENTQPILPLTDGSVFRHEQSIAPTVYHGAVLDYVKKEHADVWDWYSQQPVRSNSNDADWVGLLKTAYRLDRDSDAVLYRLADSVAEMMELQARVTLYQAQNSATLNASMYSVANEAHLVMDGPVLDTLDEAELRALMAHEFAHFELNNLQNGSYELLEQVLSAMIVDESGGPCHGRTLRCLRLYTELYCDRRAADVTGDMPACVRALIKMETGLRSVNASAYLRQADEVLTAGAVESDGDTHTEMYIRSKALELWSVNPHGIDDAVKKFIEGPLRLSQLDLLQQRYLCELTANIVKTFLSSAWMQTELMLGHALKFGFDMQKPASQSADRLREALTECDEQIRSYFCYVLLDFGTCDPELYEAPLAAAFLLCDDMGLSAEFTQLCAKELKVGKRVLGRISRDATGIVATAEKEFAV